MKVVVTVEGKELIKMDVPEHKLPTFKKVVELFDKSVKDVKLGGK